MNNLIDGMRILLSTNFTLYLKVHVAHFNVTGPYFFELHKMLDEQYNDLWDQFDVIGEKIRELDQFVSFTPKDEHGLSLIDQFQSTLSSQEYINELIKDHDRMIILLNKVFQLAETENNQAIMNYLAERLDAHAKARWFLKATSTKF